MSRDDLLFEAQTTLEAVRYWMSGDDAIESGCTDEQADAAHKLYLATLIDAPTPVLAAALGHCERVWGWEE